MLNPIISKNDTIINIPPSPPRLKLKVSLSIENLLDTNSSLIALIKNND